MSAFAFLRGVVPRRTTADENSAESRAALTADEKVELPGYTDAIGPARGPSRQWTRASCLRRRGKRRTTRMRAPVLPVRGAGADRGQPRENEPRAYRGKQVPTALRGGSWASFAGELKPARVSFPSPLPQTISRKETTMRPELESAAAELERLTMLRNQAQPGSSEHRELNHKLMKARRRLYEIEWGKRGRR
jgi:hypothetical protein